MISKREFRKIVRNATPDDVIEWGFVFVLVCFFASCGISMLADSLRDLGSSPATEEGR